MEMPEKLARRIAPAFATEAEEAKWWDANRKMVEDNLALAMKNGTIEKGTAKRLMIESRASRNITIRMADADLNLARQQAQEKGVPYQTYIKSVLHDALKRQKKRANYAGR